MTAVFVALIVALTLVNLLVPVGPSRAVIPYSRFLALVEQGRVESVSVSSTEVTGEYRARGGTRQFEATRPPMADDTTLVPLLEREGVEFTGSQPSPLGGFLTNFALAWLLPFLLLVGLWALAFRRLGPGAGAMNLGRSRHKIYDRRDLRTTFADVAGVDEAVEELREIVDFLRRPERYARLGARIPKGVLLAGPPGTGKTLLARAVAGEASVPFFYLSGSDFVELFVGLGAARVRELFQEAKEKAPCLVFIDELDTIGKTRGGAGQTVSGHDEREQTLTQLLSEMDGFDSSGGVIIMAATNRPELLDPALLRPGRFDRQIVVDRPDRRGRAAILAVHARRVALAPEVDLEVVAARTPGFAGAELANVINEAALLAARRGRPAVGMDELEEAIDRVSMGLERRSRVISPEERRRVAYHELGHALVAIGCPHADPVHRVSIVPRGVAALGVTQQLPADDRYLISQPELEDRLAVMMGGRAAERVVFDEISSGAADDLQQATALARRMVEQFGMSSKVGPVAISTGGSFLEQDGQLQARSLRLIAEAEEEMKGLLARADERAVSYLRERRAALDHLAAILLEREVLEGAELRRLLEQVETGSELAGASSAVTPGERSDS
ncbi:MAG TPA: ATP-dependent zinc metalloprotease FtsH [Solirubrobacter sp.]|nr:ATP-dependent zinc metalloprotease FtsH [Solirubrobacter sp.]